MKSLSLCFMVSNGKDKVKGKGDTSFNPTGSICRVFRRGSVPFDGVLGTFVLEEWENSFIRNNRKLGCNIQFCDQRVEIQHQG